MATMAFIVIFGFTLLCNKLILPSIQNKISFHLYAIFDFVYYVMSIQIYKYVI